MHKTKENTISVIVPVYNAINSFSRCIDSIVSQSFTNLEIIIVNDGSNDGTDKLCDDYAKKDSRIKVIHRENGGVSAARNTGIEYAAGKYITFCDCDDYYDSDWLSNLYTGYQVPDCGLVTGRYKSVFPDGEKIESPCFEDTVVRFENEESRMLYIVNHVLSNQVGWSVWAQLFRSDIINDHKVRFNTHCENFAEDLEFYLSYTIYTNLIVRLNHCGYNYCITPGSMMSKSVNVIRLNSLNEVSYGFYNQLMNGNFKLLIKEYPIIHFMIMNNQYKKLVGSDKYQNIGEEINKIKRVTWYKNNTRKIHLHIPKLLGVLGLSLSIKVLILSDYCLNQNWQFLSRMSALYYRFFNPGEKESLIIRL